MEFRLLGPLEVVDGRAADRTWGSEAALGLGAAPARARPAGRRPTCSSRRSGTGTRPRRRARACRATYRPCATCSATAASRPSSEATRCAWIPARSTPTDSRQPSAPSRMHEPATALERLRDALRLVRGEPLEDFGDEPWAEREAAHLDELVLGALEARIDAELELGEHRELVPELERLVAQHPYREHLLEQLMLALYRCGRQADALDWSTVAARRDCAASSASSRAGTCRRSSRRSSTTTRASMPPRAARARRAALRRRFGWKLIAAGGAVIAACGGRRGASARHRADERLVSRR